ncbi:hypothetical protein ACCT04_36625, partial [Rhizobium ruizarguesonis]
SFSAPSGGLLRQAQSDQKPGMQSVRLGCRCFEKRRRFDEGADMIMTMPSGLKALRTNQK